MKYKDILKEGEESLREADVPDYKVDAWELFSLAFHIDRKDCFLYSLDECRDEAAYNEYKRVIGLRATRVPLQHITGHTGFMDLDFLVNSDVLCPRQDTEILVEQALKHLKSEMRLLDLCTGSGCVLISLMHLVKNVEGFGVDISEKALAVAKENSKKNFVHPSLYCGNLFEPVAGLRFDVITANPPYIPSDIIPKLMPEVRDHEPRAALDGDVDGLKYYRLIVDGACDYLNEGGWLLFEIGVTQKIAVETLLFERGFTDIHCFKDLSGNDRVVSAQWFGSL